MKRRLGFFMFCLVSCWLVVDMAQADMLYLKNGDEYKGALEKMTPDVVSFLVEETNEVKEFPRAELMHIELSQKRAGDEATVLTELNDELLVSVIKSAPGAVEHPDAGYLTLYEEVNIKINPDQSCIQTRRIIRKVLQRRGIRVANSMISYLAQEEALVIDFARTINPAGKLFHIADNAIEDGSVNSSIPEYENLHRLKFALPEVKVGSVIDYQTTRSIKKISTLVPFVIEEYLRYHEPLLKKVVTVTVPKKLSLARQVVRSHEKITHSIDEIGSAMKYTWVVTGASRIKDEPQMPSDADILPKVVVGLKTDEAEIGQSYLGVLDKKFKPNPALKSKVKELIKDYQTPETQARALYNYVACEIGYIGVAPTSFSYLPKPLGRIFNNKFGNSLDKCYLLYGMLKLAGLDPAFFWIRSQAQGELIPEVLSLGQFNAPLVVLAINNQFKYLCPIKDNIPFDTLLANQQGVYGLLIKSKGFQQMIKTPLYRPDQETSQNNFEITLLANGDIIVRKKVDLGGNHEIFTRSYKNLKPEELTRELQQVVKGIHPNARLVDYHISDLKDLDQQVKISIEYQISVYAIKAGDELLVFKLPEIDYSAASVGKETREFPIDWDTNVLLVNQITINVPKGYKVYYLPKNYSCTIPSAMSYQSQTEVKQQEIIFKDSFRREVISLTPEKYPEYKKCLETMATMAKEWIILAKE